MPTTLERPDLREAPIEESDLLVEESDLLVEAPPTEMPEREMLTPKKPIRWMRWTLALVILFAAAGFAFFAFFGDGDETVSDTGDDAALTDTAAPDTAATITPTEGRIAPELVVPAFRGVPEPVSVTFISGSGSAGVQALDRTFIAGGGPEVPEPVSVTFISGNRDYTPAIDAPEPLSVTFIPGNGSQTPDPVEVTFISGNGSDHPVPVDVTFISGR